MRVATAPVSRESGNIPPLAQDEQANDHNEKQDHVGNYCGDKTKYAGHSLDNFPTDELCRYRSKAKQRMRWAQWCQKYRNWLFTHAIAIHQTTFVWDSRDSTSSVGVRERDLFLTWNSAAIPHTVIASVTKILFLFQISANGINEHLILENLSLCGVVNEDLHAKNN